MIGLGLLLSCTGTRGPALPAQPPALVVTPAPEADLVYFVMVDRFANGETANDGMVDLSDPHAFHGGDLQGVLQRLDYLEELGVGTVWLSPVFRMRTEPFGGWGAFHGYWVEDLLEVEPRFGGDDALIRLGQELDRRGMRLVLDMVYNHSAMDGELVQQRPDWFHDPQPIEDWSDPHQLVNHQVHGLPDLDQDNPQVYAHLLDASLKWGRTAGVDGFRVDAVRHMSTEFLARMSGELKAELGQDFWLLGEDFQGDAAALSQSFQAGGFDAMFDFPTRYALMDVFCRDAHPGRLAATLSLDRLYDDPHGLVSFLDNHDTARAMSDCGGAEWRVRQALMAQFFLRGTPSITWGSELFIDGAEEPANRKDMPWEQTSRSSWVESLQAARARSSALRVGDTQVVHVGDGGMTLTRSGQGDAVALMLNTGDTPQPLLPMAPRALWWAGPEGSGQDLAQLKGVLPPRTLLLAVLEPPEEAAAAATPVQAQLSIAGIELSTDEQLLLVGAGPELGGWNPAEGLAVVDGQATLDASAGLVFEFKLVVSGPEGYRWEPRANRYLHLKQQEPQQTLRLQWGQPG